MAWFREGRRRGRLEGVHVDGERGALLLGEVVDDADPLAARALGGALRALVVRQVVREALGRDRLAREARRAKVRVINARPPHTETGLADRAIEGRAPRMPEGLSPETVAKVIAEAIDGDVADLPSSAFG